jgi:hypothetical protein
VASLRLDDHREGNPFAACIRSRHALLVCKTLAYSMISNA